MLPPFNNSKDETIELSHIQSLPRSHTVLSFVGFNQLVPRCASREASVIPATKIRGKSHRDIGADPEIIPLRNTRGTI